MDGGRGGGREDNFRHAERDRQNRHEDKSRQQDPPRDNSRTPRGKVVSQYVYSARGAPAAIAVTYTIPLDPHQFRLDRRIEISSEMLELTTLAASPPAPPMGRLYTTNCGTISPVRAKSLTSSPAN